MMCDELRPDYLLYAMGAMAEPEWSEMRAHLARGCKTCTSGVREASAFAYSIGATVEGPAPPPRLRGRVLAMAGAAPVATSPLKMPFWHIPLRPWHGWSLAAACIALLMVPGFLWYRQSLEMSAAQAATEARLRQEERSAASLREQLARLDRAAPRSVPIFSLELARGQGNLEEPVKQLPISPGTTDIVLALPMDLIRQASAAELRDASEQIIWSAAPLPVSDSDSAGLSIPAKLLPPGRYSLLLHADKRMIARMPFRVTK